MHVIVVGAGIVGAASAWALARRGVDVTVLDKGSIGGGSTERSVGGIRTQFSTRVNVELSLASLEVWSEFEDLFGVDPEFRRNGYLFLAREPSTAGQFRENVRMQTDCGVPSEFLSPAEATDYCEGIDPEPFVGATYAPTDGYADPHLGLQGFVRGAREEGADIRTNTPVTDVITDDAGVTGVRVGGHGDSGERIDADYVVNAAGPWARRVGEMAGLDLPVAPKRRQMAVVAPERPVPETDPLVIDLDDGSHFRPERDGAALVGGHFGGPDPDADPDAFDGSVDLEWSALSVEKAADYADYFGPEAAIKRGWAGLYAVTPDHHPILEETIPGFVNAVGFSGHGFQHSPATGKIVAEIVTDGEASLVDVSALSAGRFDDGSSIVEHNVA